VNTEFRRAAAVFLALAPVVAGCGRPAQIGPDRDAMKAVDALYTAVGLRDETLVNESRSRLNALHGAGKLPGAAFNSLEAIVAEAKGGDWEPAQARLGRFMEGQRGETAGKQ
jgi:hypothetical protein